MREEFKSIEGNKIRTLKLHERAVDPDDEFGREVDRWLTNWEAWRNLCDHLEAVGMFPDEYFKLSAFAEEDAPISAGMRLLPENLMVLISLSITAAGAAKTIS